MELAPQITITSPSNSTHALSSPWLNFSISKNVSWIGYSLDGTANITITGNTTLNTLAEGSHSVVIYANDTFGNMNDSEVIWFTVDTLPPDIAMISPANATYTIDSVWLVVTLNEPWSWMGYSLDGGANVTITGNILLQNLSEGSHSIIVYANDLINNSNVAMMGFSIELPSTQTTTSTPSPTPTSTIITVISVIYETTWVTQATTEFPIVAIFAGIAAIFLFKRKRGKNCQ